MRSLPSRTLRTLLAAGLPVAACWFYATEVLPLAQRNDDLAQRAAGLQRKLEHVRLAERRTIALETEGNEARAALQRRLQPYPGQSAQIWIPEVVRNHFQQFGFPIGVIRANTVLPEKGMPGFNRAYWAVDIPIAGGEPKVPGLLLAVAELQEQHRIVKVLDFEIRPGVENPRALEAVMNLQALVRE